VGIDFIYFFKFTFFIYYSKFTIDIKNIAILNSVFFFGLGGGGGGRPFGLSIGSASPVPLQTGQIIFFQTFQNGSFKSFILPLPLHRSQ